MTNTETIEKLNDGLVQLIDAYEILQNKNTKLEEEIVELKSKNEDLEYKLSDFSTNNEAQVTKMDGMLNKIHTLLKPSKRSSEEVTILPKTNMDDNVTFDESSKNEEESILDIKLEDKANEIKDDFKQKSTNKIDLGRMENLLNGLNNR